jgi:hypothetical protein
MTTTSGEMPVDARRRLPLYSTRANTRGDLHAPAKLPVLVRHRR